jgi:hypothetical protein
LALIKQEFAEIDQNADSLVS